MKPASALLVLEDSDATVAKPAAAAPSKPAAAKPSREMFVITTRDFAALDQYIPAWEDLAAEALEPNPFYEWWMLIPALRTLGEGKNLQLVLVFAPNRARPAAPPILCGVFPLERKSRYKGLPISVLSLWKHLFCFLCTPLVRADCARECLSAFFDWLATDASSSPLIEFSYLSGEGPFHQALAGCLYQRTSLSFVSNLYNRALFRPAASADDYLRTAMSREHRKDIRRRTKRLADTGPLEFARLETEADADTWIEEFLQLEKAGWKGKLGGALAANDARRRYFTTIAKEALQRGRLMLLALKHNGEVIAQKCNFLAGDGAFAFKIAYAEEYAHYSPGLLLEIENIRCLHDAPAIHWMDSCAAPEHPMINRLWCDRRTIQTVVIPTGKRPGELVVSLLPLLRWFNRKLRGVTKPTYADNV